MKQIIRILKNSFWYVIIMLAGIAYQHYAPLDLSIWCIGFPLYAILLWLLISKVRQIVRL